MNSSAAPVPAAAAWHFPISAASGKYLAGAQAVKPPVVRAVTLKIRVPKAFDPEAFCDQISQSLGRKGFVRLDVYLSRSRRHVKVGWS